MDDLIFFTSLAVVLACGVLVVVAVREWQWRREQKRLCRRDREKYK